MDTTNQQNQTQQKIHGDTIVEFPKKSQGNASSSGAVADQTITQIPQQPPQSQISGTGHKELEPMPSIAAKTEFVPLSERGMEIPPEIEVAGIESVSNNPTLSQEVRNLGVHLAVDTIVTEKEEEEAQLHSPFTKTEVEKIIKGNLLQKDASNPMVWLALLIMRQFQMFAKRKQEEKKTE